MISKVRPAVLSFALQALGVPWHQRPPWWWSLCQLRARLDSVCLHLSSRCGNLSRWNAEVSKALLNGNSSLAWLYIWGCEEDALLPRTLAAAAAAEQEILLAFLTSISTCGGMERWVSHTCLMIMHTVQVRHNKTVWSSVKTFKLQDLRVLTCGALGWSAYTPSAKTFFIYTSLSYCFDKHGSSHKSKHLQKDSLLTEGWLYKCSVSLTWPFMPLLKECYYQYH